MRSVTPGAPGTARETAPSAAASLKAQALIFAALGDETRLKVLDKLLSGEPQSIVRLTKGTDLTRQAVRKHLSVLEGVGVVRFVRVGREMRFELEPRPFVELRAYLDHVSTQWDKALARLKVLVEE
jgi:DNA-binding transcriptional ArsR family regulator